MEIEQLGYSALPFCLSLGYVLCVLIKKGEVVKATQLWNEVNGCFGDQCQALYIWCFRIMCRKRIEKWFDEVTEQSVVFETPISLGWKHCMLLMKECCELIRSHYGFGF